MAPKRAEPAGKKAEPVQDLPPSALELSLPIWSDAAIQQDTGSPGKAVMFDHRPLVLLVHCCAKPHNLLLIGVEGFADCCDVKNQAIM